MNKKDKQKVSPERGRRVFVAMSPHKSLRDSTGQAGGGLKKHKKTVFVAISGGVDSSVAAFLLKKQGCDVIGVFIHCFNLDGCQYRDAEDARRVAAHLDIPFFVWDFEKEYKKRVVDYMIDGYKRGITPNPDVMCNKEIKFGLFFDKARAMGADYVATGHYARLRSSANNESTTNLRIRRGKENSQIRNKIRYSLMTARDAQKDQSYFLWTLTQKQLEYCLFPIGDYLKSEVREMARKAGLSTADKKDSQGICFLGKVALGDFLKKYIKPKKGEIVTISGEKIGEHDGAYFYTIGQRHLKANFQFPISNFQKGTGNRRPYYIAEKDIKTNTIVVAEGAENAALYRKDIELSDVNFFSPDLPCLISAEGGQARPPASGGNGGIRVFARVRYRQPLAVATLIIADKKYAPINADKTIGVNQRLNPRKSALLVFEQGQKFVAAGQSAVFYSKNGEMLGGGIIL